MTKTASDIVTIAVLMTSHNRVGVTLAALASLWEQTIATAEASLAVYLVDAGSADGTQRLVRERYPATTVIESDDSTYWGLGTAIAAAAAGAKDDFHMWLNDDVVLDPDAVQRLLDVARTQPGAVVVGQTRDRAGLPSYGGFRRGRRPLQFDPVGIAATITPVVTMNGNIVLVPRAVTMRIGSVDPAFPHTMGDIDFGLRLTSSGCSLLQVPGSVGVCEVNVHPDVPRTARARLAQVASIKRLPPRPWWRFCRRHAGAWALLYFIKPYARALLGRG